MPDTPGAADVVAALRAENAELKAENAQLRAQITELADRVARLERLISRNSGNSSMPPSTVGHCACQSVPAAAVTNLR